MPDNRRPCTEEEIAKLKSMAGKLALSQIAAELGRTPGATAVEASKLKVSLRTGPCAPASTTTSPAGFKLYAIQCLRCVKGF